MELVDCYKLYCDKKIPKSLPVRKFNLSTIPSAFRDRDLIIRKQGFTLLSWDWIDLLADYLEGKKCLEIMAGLGSLSYVLRQMGIYITPTDSFIWKETGGWFNEKDLWLNVEKIDSVEAIKKYGDDLDYVICSWPPYEDNIAYKSLVAMREVNKNLKMIYIGESTGGCTADDDFFASINILEDDKIEAINNIFPSWNWIHDHLELVI
jgi:hypothetical protein